MNLRQKRREDQKVEKNCSDWICANKIAYQQFIKLPKQIIKAALVGKMSYNI